jgi:cellulose synthase/poly-beta-1,6-N-acetylglucosamine synthase-like glycosyltransferase
MVMVRLPSITKDHADHDLVAPFVGHNAFLRWSALQECAKVDKEDGIVRVWSESHVSEDFEISLSLQSNGWTLRWATYSDMQFQEGVSLSAIDEMARWSKYSYGCSYVPLLFIM